MIDDNNDLEQADRVAEETLEDQHLIEPGSDELDLALNDEQGSGFDEVELMMADSDEDLSDEVAVNEADHETIEEEQLALSGTELESFESAEVEDTEFLDHQTIVSVIESVLFSTDRPQSIVAIKKAFSGTQVKTQDIKNAIEELTIEYASGSRGVCIEEVNSGFQLRTKVDNVDYLKRMVSAKPFKLSGQALEVLSIIAYKQPCIKAHVDEIRGVESGHLLRGLMDRGLCAFAGKSELPGKPMFYQSTRKFLEIFGLRNIKELPSLSEIDELIPEGIGAEEDKPELSDLTGGLSQDVAAGSYSEAEGELLDITDKLSEISTSSEFFEQEKQRERDRRDRDRAVDLKDALLVGEDVSKKDHRWLEKYEASQLEKLAEEEVNKLEVSASEVVEVVESVESVEEDEALDTATMESSQADQGSINEDELSLSERLDNQMEPVTASTQQNLSEEDGREERPNVASSELEDFEIDESEL